MITFCIIMVYVSVFAILARVLFRGVMTKTVTWLHWFVPIFSVWSIPIVMKLVDVPSFMHDIAMVCSGIGSIAILMIFLFGASAAKLRSQVIEGDERVKGLLDGAERARKSRNRFRKKARALNRRATNKFQKAEALIWENVKGQLWPEWLLRAREKLKSLT